MANIRLSVSAGGDVVGSPKHREVNAAFGHPVRGVEGFVKWVGEWNLRTLWIQVVAFGSIGKQFMISHTDQNVIRCAFLNGWIE